MHRTPGRQERYIALAVAEPGDAIELQLVTRRALGLPEWLPSTRGNVAAHAWRLAYGEREAVALRVGQPGMDRSTDLVVGTVEATEEVVTQKLAEGYDADKTHALIAEEVGGWVEDFLADHATPADPSGQSTTCREFGMTDPTGAQARHLLFELSRGIASAVAEGIFSSIGQEPPPPAGE